DLAAGHLAPAGHRADLPYHQVELVGAGCAGGGVRCGVVVHRDLDIVAPGALVHRLHQHGDRGGRADGAGQRDLRLDRRLVLGGTHHECDRAAVEVVLPDGIAGLAAGVQAAEDPLEVPDARDALRVVHRATGEEVDEGGVGGADPDDRADAAGYLLDVYAR